MDHAIPCGLLVNEILSNCLKHAFPNGRRGAVMVDLQPEPGSSAYVLSIRDDGIGLPDDFEARQTTSLGLHLIRALASQIRGTLEIDGKPRNGFRTAFSTTFAPHTAPEKDVA